MADWDILLRFFLALAFGGAIGLERRWHGHVAGPHTNALVAAGAALFVVAGLQLAGNAATPVLAQVATGIGFLAGGVILRDGMRVRGLNTAATIWGVAAIGCFVGLGRLLLAAEASALIIFANAFFHILENRIPRLRDIDSDESTLKDTNT